MGGKRSTASRPLSSARQGEDQAAVVGIDVPNSHWLVD